jgi:hypothetical protein
MKATETMIDHNRAMLELTLLNAESSDSTFDKFILSGLARNIPPEILTRMKDLWDKTEQVGEEVIAIGKIIVLKIIDFLKQHPKLAASLAIGAAVYVLSNGVPLIGPFLAPLLATLTTVGVYATSTTLDETIQMAKDFFSMLVGIFNAIADHWAA